MARHCGLLIAAVWCVAGLPAQAHHSIAEVYDEERTLVLAGEVTAFLFGDPHSLVHVRVAEPGGGTHTWAAEWWGARKLRTLGWSAGALHVGDTVLVCGNPGRDPGAYRLYLLSLTRVPTAERHAPNEAWCEPAPAFGGATPGVPPAPSPPPRR